MAIVRDVLVKRKGQQPVTPFRQSLAIPFGKVTSSADSRSPAKILPSPRWFDPGQGPRLPHASRQKKPKTVERQGITALDLQ